ncbi:hypothetical protein CNAG_02994 [Cryptococcus neoformans var. grubii H99]|uniref:AMP-activated protein kinase glycogen-binding domain-containing protein n=1 Tax=Cryptococcus neoformans (strain H99 / ATCC 208821 / CBS 10515 / FGSC 9487) TaxID=235443 RepID=J9VHM5_CRYN9|nr:hypothetical protein CNAG_02994 [Cryptococcus neoformans var. grubii H99]AFR93698.2 hypothetical protein CNAG_02994 [Cryptococcus neoformans var. grubii H99]AUB23268.1 hypothetical protein CKF44_02994 [Cryptococcus neoformans var. grubii]|eukprot:XP_012047814.1 hypothetical protein CNAG_02994 [Cryptococcus neoformans var. grubii H99]
MTQQHLATFTWGAGAQTVCVAGNFNDWSATATPLKKQSDGSFMAEVSVPWGEKQAFKYVVDGEWKVREDEAKEWDAAGNMNNVYTAPEGPDDQKTVDKSTATGATGASTSAGAAGAAAASAHAKDPAMKDATSKPSATAVPPADTADTTPATTGGQKTNPEALIAAAAPGAAVGAPILGKPVVGAETAPTSGITTTTAIGSDTTPTAETKIKDKAPVESATPFDNKAAADKAGVAEKGTAKDTLSPGPVPVAIAVPTDKKAGLTEKGTAKDVKAPGPIPGSTAASADTAAKADEPIDPAVAATTDSSGAVRVTAVDATPQQIEMVAAAANIGEAPIATVGEEHGLAEKAAEYGAAAMATFGSVVGGAAAAVEKATGVDLTHSSPLSVEEARARGINVASLEKVDAATDATSPQGSAPPASAVAALDEKVAQLKSETIGASSTTGVTEQVAMPLPNEQAPKTSYPADGSSNLGHTTSTTDNKEKDIKNDIPAQPETADMNHQAVPAPVFTTIAPKDPKKDRSLESTDLRDTAGTKPIDAAPGVDAKKAKREEETYPTGATGEKPEVAEAKKAAAPDTPEDNLKLKSEDAGKGTGAGVGSASNARAQVPQSGVKAETSPSFPATVAATTAETSQPASSATGTTATPSKTIAATTNGTSVPAAAAGAGGAAAGAAGAAEAGGAGSTTTGASNTAAPSTPAGTKPTSTSTPTQGKESSNEPGSVKKKPGFLAKIKHALSPGHKSK